MRDLQMESAYEHENRSELVGQFETEGFGEAEGAYGEGYFETEGEGAFGESFGEPFGEPFNENSFGESSFDEGMYETDHEQFLGPIGRGIGSLLGLGETEGEGYFEAEGEQFFGNILKRVVGIAKKAAPMLKSVAPIVGTAIGGPLGGMIGTAASSLLGETEGEGYGEGYFETEGEGEAEAEAVMEAPLTGQQVLGELMAAAASRAATDMEAEAQIGAATAIVLSPRELVTLRSVLPNINRGVAVLTRILRRDPETRDTVRTIPTIIKRSAASLRRQAANGRPITKQTAARTVAKQTRRVLGTPSVCAKAMQRNVRATKSAVRPQGPQRYSI